MKPTVVTFPRDDEVFATYVARCVDELDAGRARDLQALLRRWHTLAVVHVRDGLAGFGGERVWYAYRDGRPGRRGPSDWWRGPGVARVRFDDAGVFVEADAAAVNLAGRPLVGTHWSALVRPLPASADWMGEVLRRTGHVESVFDLQLAKGGVRVIRYRTVQRGGGLYESWWEEVAALPADDVSRLEAGTA